MAKVQTEQVYDFIRSYMDQVGYPPHLRDMVEQVGLSGAQVLWCLTRLQASGRLTFRPDRPRAIRLLMEAPDQPQVWEIQTAR